MDVLLTALGVAVIALAVRDIFQTLFHPVGRGRLAGRAVRIVIWFIQRLPVRSSTPAVLAGPLAYLAVLAAWTGMLVIGWALIFQAHLPEGYHYAAGLEPAANASFSDALYISLVNLTSLGYGDITPESPGLRLLGPLETIFGLGLVTASVSWLISIYQALARRDVFAHEVQLSLRAEESLGEKLAEGDPELLERILTSFTEHLIATRRDLIHFPITHAFQTEDEELALSRLVPHLRRLIDEAGAEGLPHGLKVRAEMLRLALNSFEETVRNRIGSSEPTAVRPA